MAVRGVRGATTVDIDQEAAILSATSELLQALLKANPGMQVEDIASAWFTATDDLRAAFPARAARDLGWTETALMCAQEMRVPRRVGALHPRAAALEYRPGAGGGEACVSA